MLRSLVAGISKQIRRKNFCSAAESKVVDNKNESSSILQKLSAEFGDVSHVASIIDDENVKNISIEEWKDCIYALKTFDFEDLNCFLMISRYPFLLQTPPEELKDAMRLWNACSLGLDNVKTLLSYHPELLHVQPKDIRNRMPYLQSLFKSSVSLTTTLKNSPNLLTDDWNSTLKKIDYLLKDRGTEKKELWESSALSKSLHFIMLRFEILEKCGAYKKPPVVAHKKKTFQNPHLKYIIDTSDELFSENTVGITLEEYQVYEDLFQIQNQESDEESDED